MPAANCDLSDIPPYQNMAQGRFIVEAVHESRLMCSSYKKILDPVDISLTRCLKHQAINSLLQERTASYQAGFDQGLFYSEDLGDEEVTYEPRLVTLLVSVYHRITRCYVNYASLCKFSQHVCLVTLLVIEYQTAARKGVAH